MLVMKFPFYMVKGKGKGKGKDKGHPKRDDEEPEGE